MRRGMKIFMILSLILTVSPIVMTLWMNMTGEMNNFEAIGASGFFLVMALMFLVLGYSEKGSPYLLGRYRGTTKFWFVMLCIAIGVLAEVCLMWLLRKL